MRANFFVIMSSGLLANQPKSYITAFYLPPAKAAFTADLVRDYPNVTVVDTSAVLRQVQAVLDQVIAAVEFLFAFTLVAGVLVLYAALASSHDERVREAGLLRGAMTSRGFRRYGARGPGRWITLYARKDHVYLVVAGLRFDTGWSDGPKGPKWSTRGRPNRGAVARHPEGL